MASAEAWLGRAFKPWPGNVRAPTPEFSSSALEHRGHVTLEQTWRCGGSLLRPALRLPCVRA